MNIQKASLSFSNSILDATVIVIGSGFSGIGAGIRLQQAGIPFLILEAAVDLGGTWRDNTYPGIAVDITSFTYSFSFEQNPDWSRIFAPGSELKAYANYLTDKYDLRKNMRFGVSVIKARFDTANRTWTISAKNGQEFCCRFLVAATGGLTQPKIPNIPGIDSFKGKLMHTARWDHSYDLTQKNVAVIGTGATGVQLIPAIAKTVKHLDVYQRTAIWILPKPDTEIPKIVRSAFRWIPGLQNGIRTTTTFLTEIIMVLGVVYNRQTPFIIRALQKMCLRHLEEQVQDSSLREKLTPKYDFGCKRPSFSNEYFPAFSNPNVSLITDTIKSIKPESIVTADGIEHPCDTLILGTGFKVFEKGNMPPFELYGLDNIELGEFWEANRYQAYEGATVPNFPNFFLIWGPYTASGSSWFSMIEAQVSHLMRCLNTARQNNSTWIEVLPEANKKYFDEIQNRQKDTIFYNSDCRNSNSYYFDSHGDAPFYRPSSGVEMWWRSFNFPLSDYIFK